MDICQILEKYYNIGTIIRMEQTEKGSGGRSYFVETEESKYIAKMNERIDFVKIYNKVEQKLNRMNILQSRIIKTKEDGIMAPEDLVLYQFVEGNETSYEILNEEQVRNAIKYIKRYNSALKTIPFSKEEIEYKNHWDQAKSIDFMIDEFPTYLKDCDIEDQNKQNIYAAITILTDNRSKLSNEDSQLIHGDLGPDNFIFNGDEVMCAIDFTPEYNHEWYSICQFIYWNYLWINDDIKESYIKKLLEIYDIHICGDIKSSLVYPLLLSAALFRIIGPFMEILNNNNGQFHKLEKRFTMLKKLLYIL